MCDYMGCQKKAKYELTQTIGKKQVLKVCGKHAPAWITGKESFACKLGIKPIYKVKKL